MACKILAIAKASPHITNTNGSNAIHILFANYSYDEENAEKLAL